MRTEPKTEAFAVLAVAGAMILAAAVILGPVLMRTWDGIHRALAPLSG